MFADQRIDQEQRRQRRLEQARPKLDELHTWLMVALPKVPPRSLLGKALGYLANQWSRLEQYLEDGRIPIDNNLTENAIRPFVIGRRNWLFADSPKGAQSSAALYSLIETAKANGLEPYAYLRHLFTHLPAAASVEAFETVFRIFPGRDTLWNIPYIAFIPQVFFESVGKILPDTVSFGI